MRGSRAAVSRIEIPVSTAIVAMENNDKAETSLRLTKKLSPLPQQRDSLFFLPRRGLETVKFVINSLSNPVEPNLDPSSRKTYHLELGLDAVARSDMMCLPLGRSEIFLVAI